MRSFFKFAILFLFFYNIVFLSHIGQAASVLKIDEKDRILALSSNGEILAVALSSELLFYTMISNNSQTLLAHLFTMTFDDKLAEQDIQLDLLPDYSFVLCYIHICRYYKMNPAEKSAHLLLKIDTGLEFKTGSSIVLDDKLLVSLLPVKAPSSLFLSYGLSDGRLIGKASDHISVIQSDKIHSFKRGGYSYFISTINEPDLYSSEIRAVPGNVTRTRLTRICNNDNSRDLVTRMSIHLACGKKPNEYSLIPIFDYQSSFLSTDNNRLFVLFDGKESGYMTCSYSMSEIERYYDAIWDACQQVKDLSSFQNLCLDESSLSCSFSWMRQTSSFKNCEKFGQSASGRKYTNCQTSTFNGTLSRSGWVENFFPFWGNAEAKYVENQQLDGLDDNTFVALSQQHKLRRLDIRAHQNTPFWNETVDKFSTVHSTPNRPAYVVYSTNNQVMAQQISCTALYPNCSTIKWNDPLQCSYCAFANSTGYVSDLSAKNNQTCIQAEGKIVVNQCAPIIQNVKIVDGDVTIVGEYLKNFLNLKVYLCEMECEITRVLNNVIECRQDEALSACDVQILGDLSNTPEYSVIFRHNDYDMMDDENSDNSTSGKSSRTTKFVVGIVAAVFFIAVIALIAYMITSRRCVQQENHSVTKSFAHSDFIGSGLDAYTDAYNPISTTELDSNLELYGLIAFSDYEKIEKISIIGKGNSAIVYKYRYKTSPYDVVAVKEILNGDIREIKLISQLQHPNIVEYYGYYRAENKICLVMEFLGGGELHKYLINMDNHFSCGAAFEMILQIADGMRYLAQNHIIHRDLAARNCLMTEDLETIKINDFGLGRKPNMNETYEVVDFKTKLPYRWTALECLNQAPFTEKSDVWSFGICCYEIFSRARMPYINIKTNDAIKDFLDRGERLAHPGEDNCPNELYELMLACWEEDPDERPTFEQIYVRIQEIFDNLKNDTSTDYYAIYLTPRASVNDGSISTPTIMGDKDVKEFVRNSSSGHVSSF